MNSNFTSEFITLTASFSVRNFIALILVAGLAASDSSYSRQLQNRVVAVVAVVRVVAVVAVIV